MSREVYNAVAMGPGLAFEERDGFPVWRATRAAVAVRFAGRGPRLERGETLRAIGGPDIPVAWAKQVHGAALLAARPGSCGEGDALCTAEPGLALAIATADCVPVLLSGPAGIAAVHAGWRGLVAGVLAGAMAALGDPAAIQAWIGPAIGLCCYEVGADVADAVVAATAPEVANALGGDKAHLDLAAAARCQLERAGVRSVELLVSCTRCDPRLWSYRRDGKGAGRNLAFICRSAPEIRS
jgi:purine-nucleoside/S-methyl-5'-thioadenosine phosphorylase / adenosine deaminase